ncbi:MAG: hypothetical protein GY773_25560 [Actinomycetia bacterium]|nr:hypothetical protein [Actinomycetes bacterium]
MTRIASVLIAGAVLLGLGIVLGQVGLLGFRGPELPEFSSVDVDIRLPEEARIIAVEPISLDCRARVHAQVPVEGVREHRALGQVYRTDRVALDAIGDIDTCVDGSSAAIHRSVDGTTEVVIDGSSIVFVRPRVNAVLTADSLDVSQGVIGKLTDVFPWVDDNLGLTPVAYAYAQNVIGSSNCMETAYAVTEGILVDAYRQQYVDQGVDPAALSVRIDGDPLFTDPDDIELAEGMSLSVRGGDVRCVASDDLGQARPSDL